MLFTQGKKMKFLMMFWLFPMTLKEIWDEMQSFSFNELYSRGRNKSFWKKKQGPLFIDSNANARIKMNNPLQFLFDTSSGLYFLTPNILWTSKFSLRKRPTMMCTIKRKLLRTKMLFFFGFWSKFCKNENDKCKEILNEETMFSFCFKEMKSVRKCK